MTVSSAANKVIYLGNGATTVFPFSFIGVNASDLQVIFTDALGNQTILTSSQYSVTLNAVTPPQVWGVGGSVTYNPGGIPIALGTTLTISRQVPLSQPTSFGAQGPLFPNAVEQAIDLAVMAIQQIAELQNRAIAAPISDANPPANLPPATLRANQNAIFDANGNLTAGLPVTNTASVSVAMQPVVSAATLGAARTALGLGSLATDTPNLGLQVGVSGVNLLDVNFTQVTPALPETVASTNHLEILLCVGPNSLTYNRANTYWNGFGHWIHAISGPITLNINAADQFEVGGAVMAVGASFVIPQGAFVFITTDAGSTGSWRIFGLTIKWNRTLAFVVNSTYTPSTAMAYCRTRAWGSGGAGGGTPATGANQQAAGSGASSGCYCEGTFTSAQIGASQPITIGAAAVGVNGANGNSGGTTSLGSLLVAPGGLGGLVGVLSSAVTGNIVSGAAPFTTGIVGQFTVAGRYGDPGITLASGTGSNNALGGAGADAPVQNNGAPPSWAFGAVGSSGNGATGPGGGGGGASASSSVAAQTGGSSTAGEMVIEEYIYTA